MEHSKIYAVDFDGTLNLAEEYPKLGGSKQGAYRLPERAAAGWG